MKISPVKKKPTRQRSPNKMDAKPKTASGKTTKQAAKKPQTKSSGFTKPRSLPRKRTAGDSSKPKKAPKLIRRQTIVKKSAPQIPMITIDELTDIPAETDRAFTNLTETRKQWEVRYKSLQTLRSITEYKGKFPKEYLDRLKSCLDIQIKDLRSAIVKEACSLLIVVSKVSKKEFSRHLGFYVELLFTRMPISTKAIREPAAEALEALILSCRNINCMKQLLEALKSPHVEVRLKSIKHVGDVIDITLQDSQSSGSSSASGTSAEGSSDVLESKEPEKKNQVTLEKSIPTRRELKLV
eukprot:TRINITY_DN2730_c0_g1_i1.p1 TRINITY_DN2730_c0_g1~~TRINITY_DN2730_c0_g1_i1.p1  ORF type:complete len:297 (+),score=66.90 TRINITY_DN2730_c0_g1_i1:420-1310(+)